MARKDSRKLEAEKRRNNAAAIAVVLAGIFAFSGPALALSELHQEEMQLPDQPENFEDDTIERHDLPPPGMDGVPETANPEAKKLEAPEAQIQGTKDEDGNSVSEEIEPSQMPQGQNKAQIPGPKPAPNPEMSVPLPDPIVIPRDPASQPALNDEEGEAAAATPEILYDLALLPEPVRRMRKLIMDACLSGDIERLRPLISTGKDGTQLSFGDVGGDPVAFLRELSGDDEGHEILAILYEIFSAGYVRLSQESAEDIYVWPYFFAVPLDALTAPQRVELFKIVTAGDYEDMKNYGAYIFYRAGISPQGQWLFFVAGD